MPKTWGLGGPLCKSKSYLGPHSEGGGPMMGIKLVVGSQYLGEHIGEAEAQAAWLGKKLSRLEGYVQTLVGWSNSTRGRPTQEFKIPSNSSGIL